MKEIIIRDLLGGDTVIREGWDVGACWFIQFSLEFCRIADTSVCEAFSDARGRHSWNFRLRIYVPLCGICQDEVRLKLTALGTALVHDWFITR